MEGRIDSSAWFSGGHVLNKFELPWCLSLKGTLQSFLMQSSSMCNPYCFTWYRTFKNNVHRPLIFLLGRSFSFNSIAASSKYQSTNARSASKKIPFFLLLDQAPSYMWELFQLKQVKTLEKAAQKKTRKKNRAEKYVYIKNEIWGKKLKICPLRCKLSSLHI